MIIFFWNNFLNSRDHWFVPLIHSSIDFLKNIVMHNSSTRKEMLRYFIEEDWMWDGKIFFSSMIRRVFLNLLMYCAHRQCKSPWTSKTLPHVFVSYFSSVFYRCEWHLSYIFFLLLYDSPYISSCFITSIPIRFYIFSAIFSGFYLPLLWSSWTSGLCPFSNASSALVASFSIIGMNTVIN